MARARTVAVAAISLAYPLLVYLAMGRFEPRWSSLLLKGPQCHWETWVISNGFACWAWCGWSGPAYTLSLPSS